MAEKAQERVETVFVDHLQSNPHQPRRHFPANQLEELASSIKAHGLLQPVVVMPGSAGEYVIVAGHRRVEAQRLLRDSATSEQAKETYSWIRAVIREDLDDTRLAAMAYAENVTRQGLSVVEEARALLKLLSLGTARTVEELSELTNQPIDKVKRLLRLARAPEYLQHVVEVGLLVASSSEAGEGRAHRKLDLMAALPFCQLHQHLVSQKGASAKRVEQRVRKAMERALAQSWSVRRIETFVRAEISGEKQGVSRESLGPARESSALFKKAGHRLVIDTKRLSAATDAEWEALQQALQDLRRREPQREVP